MKLTQNIFTKNKIIFIVLCFIALIGFLLPSVIINANFPRSSTSTTSVNAFNIVSLFNSSDKKFEGMDLAGTDVSGLLGGNEMLATAGLKLVLSVGSYFITIILLIITLLFTFVGKLKKTSNVMLGVSFVLYAFAGYTISTLTKVLFDGLEGSLGLFASFINIADMIKINLGIGYWLTIGTIGCMLVIKLIFYFKRPTRKLKPISKSRNKSDLEL